MAKINVLTTSPSISVDNNVSGIANLTRLWVENNTKVNYILFEAGKRDSENYSIVWLLKQPLIAINFVIKLIFKKIDIVHINLPLEKFAILRETVFVLCSALFFKPIVVHHRGGAYNLKPNLPFVIRICLKINFSLAAKILVLSTLEFDFLSDYFRVTKDKLNVLPNCVKVPDVLEIKAFEGALNLLYLGRLDKNKGLKEILSSLESLSSKVDFRLSVAGDGPDKDWFLTECDRVLSGKISYLGVVSGDQKHELLKTSEVFLLPSYYEGLPNALLEAMSYGLVPVVTPVGSIPKVIKHEINGLVVPVKDSKALTSAMMTIKGSPQFSKRLSREAYQTVKKNHSLSHYLTRVNEIYRALVLREV